ncbi:cupin domain-containing protein [Pseudarthrobacter oxydans]|uniref:cupin domain-containing protein n=1 Tax=Pseudarthrobacter oxydans TaxID=1671 RepID=UPI0015741BDB|nr:cupin domain-containing protein [Pseudarthrobacter oxydans]NSX35778.1 cupin domain-containing protein [Pseudarthrobacter oxydans]BFE43960.1 cupin domain-containing protein [Pseudarthrobacter oxydans]
MNSGKDQPPPPPGFPGGTAVSRLRVYDWESADGLCGGSPHLHTVSSEAYVVTAGTGAVHTISMAGIQQHGLAAGSLVWFSPGTVHRLVNTDGLTLNVIMSNAGLPEAGDAVLTFPRRILQDPDLYAAHAALPRDAKESEVAAAARRRRDLALEGYAELHTSVLQDGTPALAEFHRAAARLVRPRVGHWKELWSANVQSQVKATEQALRELADGSAASLAGAAVASAEQRPGEGFGMCGRLTTWEDSRL